ncbi:hypothetical protein [Endozoicomonas sp. 4G]|uniref:hypothetical protein n=1 Tax=Endozoicomonas sp. 4G TaxID=2872754 RepID=UPI0020791D53|nr:hypothetical protein [Endozoicomonas sp. 4G]
MQKIIFDFGGVLLSQSRKEIIINKLDKNNAYNTELNNLLCSDFIKDVARGNHSEEKLYSEINKMINIKNLQEIREVFRKSCEIDILILNFLSELKRQYDIFLISDSLPSYTSFIREKYGHIFEKMFFSNELGCRKSDGLFETIIFKESDVFENSVYVDDKKEFVITPSKYGAKVINLKKNNDLINTFYREKLLTESSYTRLNRVRAGLSPSIPDEHTPQDV